MKTKNEIIDLLKYYMNIYKFDNINFIVSEFDEGINIHIIYKGIIKISLYNDNNNVAWISDLHIDEEFRKQGIASLLLQFCEEVIYKLHYVFINLQVKRDTWLHKWYNRLDYLDYYIHDDKWIQLTKILK